MNTCPYCKSNKTVGVGAPKVSLTDKWHIEQLCACIDCEREFIMIFNWVENLSIEKSSIYGSEDNS